MKNRKIRASLPSQYNALRELCDGLAKACKKGLPIVKTVFITHLNGGCFPDVPSDMSNALAKYDQWRKDNE